MPYVKDELKNAGKPQGGEKYIRQNFLILSVPSTSALALAVAVALGLKQQLPSTALRCWIFFFSNPSILGLCSAIVHSAPVQDLRIGQQALK